MAGSGIGNAIRRINGLRDRGFFCTYGLADPDRTMTNDREPHMPMSYIICADMKISRIGLGCSRLGSMMGSSAEEAHSLVDAAIEGGITLFDTASTYGQGDSERFLSHALRRHQDLCIVTKIGKKVPLKARLLQPVKGLVRTLARYSGKTGAIVKKSRGGSLSTCFEPAFLERELVGSMKRLGTDCIPVIMLHSASGDVVSRGIAIEVLDRAREKGHVRVVGVSVDDIPAAEACLVDSRITMIQVPYLEGDSAFAAWATRAAAAGKIVVAREIFQSVTPRPLTDDVLRANLQRSLGDGNIGVTLVGTTKCKHLLQTLEMAEPMMG